VYVLSKGSVIHSFGETNCGSIGPPAPIESKNCHVPWLLACVVKALNVQTSAGVALGEGEGDTMPVKTDFWTSNENSVSVPLLLRL